MKITFLIWINLYSFFTSFSLAQSTPTDYTPNTVNYQIQATLNDETQSILAHETLLLTNHTGQSLHELYFHVYPNAQKRGAPSTYFSEMKKFSHPDETFLKSTSGSSITIKTVQIEHKDQSFEIHNELMQVNLDQPLLPHESLNLEIDFQTQIAPINERSSVWDQNYSVAQWFPKLMVYDSKGWALEHNSGYHYIGEFYSDFGNYEVKIRLPKGFKIAATGKKISQLDLPSQKQTEHYFSAQNVHDFAWAADPRFNETTQVAQIQGSEVQIHAFTRNSQMEILGEYAKQAIETYSKRFGPYAYKDFWIAETYFSSSMEYPQLVFMKSLPQSFPRWTEREALTTLEGTTVHEVAHQWFYGMIGNNEVLHAWLDEGFATYCEQSFMSEKYKSRDTILRFTSLFELGHEEAGELFWRYGELDYQQPIETPSYKFIDPKAYLTKVYQKTAIFFKHFESIIGREKLDEIFKAYYKNSLFKNATPENWYNSVEQIAGKVARVAWENWIKYDTKSDYAVENFKTTELPSGEFINDFEILQKQNHFFPVDFTWQTCDSSHLSIAHLSDESHLVRANISSREPSISYHLKTATPICQITVDPQYRAPDLNRFNNEKSFFPSIELWPWTTRHLERDRITLFPLPYVSKKPGLGFETGILTGLTHYLDWVGTVILAQDWHHNNLNSHFSFLSLKPNLPFNWEIKKNSDALSNDFSLTISKSLGPEIGHDPRHNVGIGIRRYGSLNDNRSSFGPVFNYDFKNEDQGSDWGEGISIHDSPQFGNSLFYNRTAIEGMLRYHLAFQTQLKMNGYFGRNSKVSPRSALFDLQSPDEGAMRFESDNLDRFKSDQIKRTSFEFHFPIPYFSFIDSSGILYGPTLEGYLFSDFSRVKEFSGQDSKLYIDAGLGIQFDLALATAFKLGMALEVVTYQNVETPYGFGFQSIVFGLKGQ